MLQMLTLSLTLLALVTMPYDRGFYCPHLPEEKAEEQRLNGFLQVQRRA